MHNRLFRKQELHRFVLAKGETPLFVVNSGTDDLIYLFKRTSVLQTYFSVEVSGDEVKSS